MSFSNMLEVLQEKYLEKLDKLNIGYIVYALDNEKEELKFIYDINNKRLGKKHISLVKIELEIKDNQIIKLKGYDEM